MNIFSIEAAEPFVLFQLSHLLTMLLIALIWLAVPLRFAKRIDEKKDRIFRMTAAVILVGQYLSWILYELATDRFDIKTSLPLNLCDFSNFLLAYLLITTNKKLFEVLYFWAVAGTLQSFVTPNITFAFPHLEFWVFYIQHGGEVLVILYFVFVLKYRPLLMSAVKAYLWLLAFVAAVYLINLLLGSNYMFLMADTPQPSTITKMIALFGEPPRHMIGLSAIAFVSIALLIIPWLIKDKLSPN